MKIEAMKGILHLQVYMKFSLYFPYFLPNLRKIHYRHIHKTLLKDYHVCDSHHQENPYRGA